MLKYRTCMKYQTCSQKIKNLEKSLVSRCHGLPMSLSWSNSVTYFSRFWIFCECVRYFIPVQYLSTYPGDGKIRNSGYQDVDRITCVDPNHRDSKDGKHTIPI